MNIKPSTGGLQVKQAAAPGEGADGKVNRSTARYVCNRAKVLLATCVYCLNSTAYTRIRRMTYPPPYNFHLIGATASI